MSGAPVVFVIGQLQAVCICWSLKILPQKYVFDFQRRSQHLRLCHSPYPYLTNQQIMPPPVHHIL